MKYIILFITLMLPVCAQKYDILFNDIKLGEIKKLENIENNYISIDVTNSIASFLLGKDKVLYYNPNCKLERNDKNTKYKKDKYEIINILKLTTSSEQFESKRFFIRKDKFIDVNFKNGIYYFVYNSKNRVKSEGQIEVKNNKLISLLDKTNSVEIKISE